MKIKFDNMNSVALALLIFSGLTGYLCSYIGISNSFLTVNMITVMIAVVLSEINRFIRGNHKLPFRMGLYVIYLTVMVLWGIYVKQSDYTILQFIVYVLSAAIIVSNKFKMEIVLRLLTYSSLLFVPFYGKVFELTYVTLNQANMGTMYKLLNIVAAGLIHFVFYRKGRNKTIWLGYSGCFVLLLGILSKANRGVVLSVIFVIAICVLNGHSGFEINKTVRNKKRIRFLIIAAVIAVITFNFENIIVWTYNIWGMVSNNVPSFLIKMNKYIMLDDATNGRDEVYKIAFKLISEHPIAGIGIENFGKYYKVNYPHNFILQLLIEGGPLFLAVPLLSSLFLLYHSLFNYINNKELRVSVIFTLCLMLPRFLISLDIWTYYEFWIPIFFALTRSKLIKRYTVKGSGKRPKGSNIKVEARKK